MYVAYGSGDYGERLTLRWPHTTKHSRRKSPACLNRRAGHRPGRASSSSLLMGPLPTPQSRGSVNRLIVSRSCSDPGQLSISPGLRAQTLNTACETPPGSASALSPPSSHPSLPLLYPGHALGPSLFSHGRWKAGRTDTFVYPWPN